MQDNKFLFLKSFYLKELSLIRDVHFTSREVDVISGILHVRGTNKIASLLSIAPNTVVSHVNNIMSKLRCNSREGIIDFIEQSDKLALLREYYVNLLLESAFKKALKAISKLKDKKVLSFLYIVWENEAIKDAIIQNIESHLKYAGINSKTREQKNEEECKIELLKGPNHALIIFLEKKFLFKNYSDSFDFVDASQQSSYYLLVFEVLQKLVGVGEIKLENIVNNFLRYYNGTPNLFREIDFLVYTKKEEQKNTLSILINFLEYKKMYFCLATCCLAILLFWVGYYFLGEEKEMYLTSRPEPAKSFPPAIQSDLALPASHFLLYRPEKIAQIDKKLKGQNGIQAVALIGSGGAGKTILARQYAHQQRAGVIWELNAETNENLKYSFESLARALAKTAEDKKILRSLQEIKDSAEKEEQLIQFVKERLKSHSHWFLIYDNMEKFADIQKYFPQDPRTWGEGKIILTTRNRNLQNNSYLNGAIQIKELTAAQKLTLFMKIMANEEYSSTNPIQEIKGFLENIPPYPLDIVVAAYYLKSANISFSEYLENLSQNNKDISLMQEDLLKDAGNYAKTRYSILTLSLKHLIHKHKDFKSLLLFISLLDSQNIPRKMLLTYKKNFILDTFVYNLKKYSLITDESLPSSLEQTISFHRSTQEIILDYLVGLMIEKERSHTIYDIFNAIEQYTDERIEEEEFSKIQLLAAHYEAFLKHNALLDNNIKNVLHAELGNIYYFLGDAKKGKELLEVSIEALDQPHYQKQLIKFLIYLGKIYVDTDDKSSMKKLILTMNKRYKKHFSSKDGVSAKILSSLGDMYDSLGYYEKAKDLLQNTVIVNKKYAKNYPELAWSLALLGNVCRKMGKYSEAKDFLEESLGVYKNFISENHFRTGWILIHLGNIYAAMGEHKKAHRLIEEGVTIYKKYYPENHPDLAWATSYLGHIYTAVGEYERAQELLQKTLMILKRSFSESHGTLLRTNAYLANAYLKSGNYQEARNILEQILKNYEQMNDPDLIEFAMATQVLAEVNFLERNEEVAEKLMNKALKIFTQHKHPHVLRCLESLTEVYLKKSIEFTSKGNIEAAETFKDQAITSLNQAVEAATKHFPADSPHIRRIQLKLKGLGNE